MTRALTLEKASQPGASQAGHVENETSLCVLATSLLSVYTRAQACCHKRHGQKQLFAGIQRATLTVKKASE